VLARGRALAWLTVGWNVVEGVVAVAAALVSGSVALLGFGIDSFVESASGVVVLWRLGAELRGRLSARGIARIEHRARRLVAASLFLLALYVGYDAISTLTLRERPSFTAVGVAVTALSLVVMLWLAREKRRVARELDSRAMQADAFQTTACWWLSLATLFGIGMNGLFGWWWADPVAGLAIAALVVREARQTYRGETCC
jgi:cation diffusion facilitator family transporter